VSPDLWPQIEALFHAAMEQDRAERDAFLDHACVGDEVRREVESLIAQATVRTNLLDRPAWALDESLSAAISTHIPLTPGMQIGPYKIGERLGVGGMGEVFRARDSRLGRQVAVKVLPNSLANNASARERLRREAASAAALDHPFICKVYEMGEERDLLFLVMEFVEGQTLHQRLQDGSLPLSLALQLAGEMAEALEKAHGPRFVHRDLKPANVMISHGHVKVMDFGLAKQFDPVRKLKIDGLSSAISGFPPSEAL
jgi:serine/threonine protein kinase